MPYPDNSIAFQNAAITLSNREWRNFWSKVNKTDSCWLWTAAQNGRGYGLYRIHRHSFKVHRFSYMLHHGPIPEGLCVCHSCDVPTCVNPAHLWAGTFKDNHADMCAKGRRVLMTGKDHWSVRHPEWRPRGDNHWSKRTPERIPKGERHHMAILTARDILAIRASFKPGWGNNRRLARKYGISETHMSEVIHRKTWTHI